MGIDLEYWENEDNFNEFERENRSMNNAYKLLLGGIDNWELEFKADNTNTHLESTHKSIDTLITYFEKRQEYEKCNNLKKLKIIRNKTWI
tara:strand:+ start:19 stop:288 length:270 start_codon:yes stop_codon:yes gene_type:complete